MNISPISSVNTPRVPAPRGSNSAIQAVLAAEYSTRAGGKTRSANIQPVGDGYKATIPNLPGMTATGSSVERVESSLNNLIDFFA